MSKSVVTLDVREDLKRGKEPFSMIMRTVAGLSEQDDLLLIAPFEPAPLYAILQERGYSHVAKATASGDWEVRFSRAVGEHDVAAGATGASVALKPPCAAKASERMVEVDARGLEPPEPLVRILESLAQLPVGARLRARTDRRPIHLYAQLEERGFIGQSREESDGSFITDISHS
jgi:uncharacterized protein (DUF2249 family)